MNKVTRGNMRNVLDFELEIRVLHVGPSTDKADMEAFTGKEVIAIPEEGAFFIKGLGIPVMRWNYVIKMGQMIHVIYQSKDKKLQIRYRQVMVGQYTDMMVFTVGSVNCGSFSDIPA